MPSILWKGGSLRTCEKGHWGLKPKCRIWEAETPLIRQWHKWPLCTDLHKVMRMTFMEEGVAWRDTFQQNHTQVFSDSTRGHTFLIFLFGCGAGSTQKGKERKRAWRLEIYVYIHTHTYTYTHTHIFLIHAWLYWYAFKGSQKGIWVSETVLLTDEDQRPTRCWQTFYWDSGCRTPTEQTP